MKTPPDRIRQRTTIASFGFTAMKMHPFQVIHIFVADARHQSTVVATGQQIGIFRGTVGNAFDRHHVPGIIVAFEFLDERSFVVDLLSVRKSQRTIAYSKRRLFKIKSHGLGKPGRKQVGETIGIGLFTYGLCHRPVARVVDSSVLWSHRLMARKRPPVHLCSCSNETTLVERETRHSHGEWRSEKDNDHWQRA